MPDPQDMVAYMVQATGGDRRLTARHLRDWIRRILKGVQAGYERVESSADMWSFDAAGSQRRWRNHLPKESR